jgi:hypothetical protein
MKVASFCVVLSVIDLVILAHVRSFHADIFKPALQIMYRPGNLRLLGKFSSSSVTLFPENRVPRLFSSGYCGTILG